VLADCLSAILLIESNRKKDNQKLVMGYEIAMCNGKAKIND
jgi:hypothetical protein